MKIGLTGGIASGKSTITAYLRQRNIPVMDADEVVHLLYAFNSQLRFTLAEWWGQDIFMANGAVDRVMLGQHVFANPTELQRLNALVHPLVREQLLAFMDEHAASPLVVVVIPLLFENGLQDLFDAVWLCSVPRDVQLERLMTTRGLTPEAAEARINQQLTLEQKLAFNPTIIDCTGPLEQTYSQVDQLLCQTGITEIPAV
jgi:dephospho-CoA kinase